MQELTNRFEACLAKRRPDYLADLNPGLSDLELNAWSTGMGVEFPDDFLQLYHWRNGQNDNMTRFENLAYTYEWLSMQRVEGMLAFHREDFEEHIFARHFVSFPNWLPFLSTNGGDTYFIDLEGTAGGVPGEIVVPYHDNNLYSITHPSLRAWLETLVVGYETEVIGYDEDGFWDSEGFAQVYESINPGYPKIVEY